MSGCNSSTMCTRVAHRRRIVKQSKAIQQVDKKSENTKKYVLQRLRYRSCMGKLIFISTRQERRNQMTNIIDLKDRKVAIKLKELTKQLAEIQKELAALEAYVKEPR